MLRAGFLLERASKKRTPVDTGFLRASHRVLTGAEKVILRPFAPYAVYVHEGTRFMKSRPFLQWAVEDTKTELDKLLRGTGIKIATQIVQ